MAKRPTQKHQQARSNRKRECRDKAQAELAARAAKLGFTVPELQELLMLEAADVRKQMAGSQQPIFVPAHRESPTVVVRSPIIRLGTSGMF